MPNTIDSLCDRCGKLLTPKKRCPMCAKAQLYETVAPLKQRGKWICHSCGYLGDGQSLGKPGVEVSYTRV